MKTLVKSTCLLMVTLTLPAAAAGEPRPVPSHVTQVPTPVQANWPTSLRKIFSSYYTAQEQAAGFYAGSEFCLMCHKTYAGWHDTLHATTLIKPMTQWSLVKGKGVLADYDQNGVDDFVQGLDFNKISSPFDAYKPNAPKLSVKNGVYTITIGTLDFPIIYAQQWRWPDTGEWAQIFAVRVPVTDSPTGYSGIFSSVLQYETESHQWSAYAPEAWYDVNNQPLFGATSKTADVVAVGESHDQNCLGCHATGMRSITQNAQGGWDFKGYAAILYKDDDPTVFDLDGDGTKELVNIGCESCHGPGSNHLVEGGSPGWIFNPAKATAQAANDSCGQCHSVAASTPTGVIGWPYNETTKTSWNPLLGQPLAAYTTDAEVWWPDGKTGIDTSQYPEFYKSIKPTFQFHQVKCIECHSVHAPTGNPAQIVATLTEGGTSMATKVEDNTLCLGCHATHAPFDKITTDQVANYADNRTAIGAIVSTHSNHPYGPERMMGLSRCTLCHMATTGGPGELKLHGHTFEAVPPTKTLAYQDQGGMPSSCALSCHAEKVNSFSLGLNADPDPANWVWNDQFNKDLATALQAYYGPNGTWWKTPTPAPTTRIAAATKAPLTRPHHRTIVRSKSAATKVKK
jgi:hypothetical protein